MPLRSSVVIMILFDKHNHNGLIWCKLHADANVQGGVDGTSDLVFLTSLGCSVDDDFMTDTVYLTTWAVHSIIASFESCPICDISTLQIWVFYVTKQAPPGGLLAWICSLFKWQSQFVLLDRKGCICDFTKWQIHPFISNGTNCDGV